MPELVTRTVRNRAYVLHFGEECVVGGVRIFCQELLSTKFRLVDVFLDVTSLYYYPEFSQKHYFVFSYSHPLGHRT